MASSSVVARQAIRSLWRQPGFTVTAVLTLGLGIGAVTAVYAMLDRVALQPLPYPEAERLVWLESRVPLSNATDSWGISEAGYFHFREHSATLEAIGALGDAFGATHVSLSDVDMPRLAGAKVSASALPLLGARTVVGRLFDSSDDEPGSAPVVVLGHDVWRSVYAADPGVIGSSIGIDGAAHEVIGVMAPGVHLPDARAGVWLPLRLDASLPPTNDHWVAAIARLAPGASLADAQRELAELTARFPEVLPSAYSQAWMQRQGFGTHVVALADRVIGNSARLLWTLLGAVGLVLLIAFANVASLFLVRTEARRREFAIRAALGAGTRRLLWLGVTDGLVVCAAATALGIVTAMVGVKLFAVLAPTALPRLADVAIGGTSIAFAALAGLACAAALGGLPLIWSRGDVDALRDGARHSASRKRTTLRATIVVAQIALALMLLTSAALLLRSFQQLRNVPAGFDPAGVMVTQVVLPEARYGDAAASARFYERLIERVEALPGVMHAGAATHLPTRPLDGCYEISHTPAPPPGTAWPCVALVMNTPGYLETLDVHVTGRIPDRIDAERGEVVITKTLADRLWPGEDPLGREVWGFWWGEAPRYRVAGVTGELRLDGLDRDPTAAVFLPPTPFEGTAHWGPYWGPHRELYLAVRAATNAPQSLAPAVRDIVRELDPEAVVAVAETFRGLIARSDSVARASLLLILLGISGAVAVFLSAVGLYGVVAYVVAQRTREIGLRMALGAHAAQVGGMVLRRSFALALAGIAIGMFLNRSTGHLLEVLLFDVAPTDPGAALVASLVLVLVVLLAAFLPARHAMRVSPMAALRD
jgi:putative ABC transport system permease protein